MTNNIGWCDETANWQAGCSYASPGCFRCWALAMTRRHAENPRAPARYCAPNVLVIPEGWTENINWSQSAMNDAFRKIAGTKTHKRWFLGSMTDLFHEHAPAQALSGLAAHLKNWLPGQTLILSTKRPTRLLEWQQRYFPGGLPSNVWCLLSVANQEDMDEKSATFSQVQASILGYQFEPLLGPVTMLGIDRNYTKERPLWAIIGPENGPHARPYDPAWGRDLAQQCADAGVKVWGKAGSGIERQEVPQ